MTRMSEKVIWHFETDEQIHHSPTVVGGRSYFSDEEGNLYSVDVDSGTEQWCFSVDEYVQGSPVVVNGMVYFDTSHGHTYAVDANTGVEKWRYSVGFNGRYTEPAVADGVVYTVAGSTFRQQIHAIDADMGQVLWTFDLRENDDRGSVGHPLKITNSILYFISDGGVLYAVDTETGEMKWSLDGFYISTNETSYPTIIDGYIYIGCHDGLYKIGTKNKTSVFSLLSTSAGKIKWSHEDGWFLSPVTTSKSTIYATEKLDGKLYAFKTSGGIKWQTALPAQSISAPRLINGRIYVSNNSHLIVVDGDSGQQLETIKISRSLKFGAPVINNGIAYIGGYDGLRAVDINSQQSYYDHMEESSSDNSADHTKKYEEASSPANKETNNLLYCSECGNSLSEYETPQYCPSCGANL
ncbi:hypothetical protein B9H04_06775 [Halorubrum ezzemoulense DSM 17463]|uniref:Pyrrolo-quinoline quinone repeat domain-containing protein n=1 Tax=Halorubrum ezzemoulense DSM 17463 TaxID=1121945 RepID=A0A1X4H8Y8_HALEZ|nr:PQQ-binding-like beta-propeller repeat protein [Halorubrum ezzemoulense]OSP08262.1 hypothetical protein B9H04_06775 [Halorubrum ezzemoulense DSM 17463]